MSTSSVTARRWTRPRFRHRLPPRGALLTILVGVIAVAAGAGLAAGGATAGAVALLAAAPLLVLLAERLRFTAILIWVVAEGLATPFLRFPQQHALVTFDRVWIPLTLIGLLGLSVRRTHTLATRRLAAALTLFVVCVGLRILFTTPTSIQRYAAGLWVDAVLLPTVLFFVIRASNVTTRRVQQFAGAFALGGMILSLTAILEKLAGFELATRSGGTVFVDPAVGIRYSGPYAQPDMLAVALLICLAMTLLWMQIRGSSVLVYGLVVVALELVGIWLTYFRGAWIAALVVMILSLGLRPRRYGRLVGFTGLALVIALVAFFQIGDTQSSLSARVGNTQNLVGRVATYRQGLQIFAHHPVFGVGVVKYETAQATAASVSMAASKQRTRLTIFTLMFSSSRASSAFWSLVFLSFAIWQLVRQLRRSARTRTDILLGACLAAAALAYFILALEETVLLQGPPNLLFAACLGVGAARLDAARSEDQSA